MSDIETPEELRKFLIKNHQRCKMIRFFEFYSEKNPTIVIVCYFSKWEFIFNSPYKLLRPIKYDIEEFLPEGINFKLIAGVL